MQIVTAFAGAVGLIGVYFVGAELYGRAGFSNSAGVSSRAGISDPVGKCGYYVNAGGQQVSRPCGNWRNGGERPAGATAKCADGSWSWSKHPNYSGTCSHHGGTVGR